MAINTKTKDSTNYKQKKDGFFFKYFSSFIFIFESFFQMFF